MLPVRKDDLKFFKRANLDNFLLSLVLCSKNRILWQIGFGMIRLRKNSAGHKLKFQIPITNLISLSLVSVRRFLQQKWEGERKNADEN
jgi:hypothetical protein